MKTWKSETLKKHQLVIIILSGALFAALLVFFAMRAFRGKDAWMFVGDDPLVNALLLFIVGVLLSGFYFIKDFIYYDKLILTIDKDNLSFETPRMKTKQFNIKEMRQVRTFGPMYSWFGYKKLMMQFKSQADFRRHQQVILIKSADEVTISEDLKAAKKKAKNIQRVAPKTNR